MADIDLNEKLANLGYLMIEEEFKKGEAAQPSVTVPLYSEDITTNINLDEDNPIVNNRAARYKVFRGQEDYQGTIKVLAEPKTAPHFFKMLLNKSSSSGGATSGYTHTFGLGDVASYTIEFKKGEVVYRFVGVEASSIKPVFEDNKMAFEITISALNQFSVAKISSQSTTTLTLDDTERDNPNEGLTTDDTIRLYDVSAGTYEDIGISSINSDGKTVTLSSSPSGSYTSGDLAWLVPQSISDSTQLPFTWSNTEFRFASDASTALNATQTRVEQDSNFAINYSFEDSAGAKRSGKAIPAALVRTTGDIEVSIKKFFEDGQERDRFLQNSNRALVIRSFSKTDAGTDGTSAELRVTIPEYYLSEDADPLNTGEIIYSTMTLKPVYNTSDSEIFNVKVINDEAGSEYSESSSSSSSSSSS